MSSPMPVENGDLFLLCSNGLTDYLSDDRISYILSMHMSNERLAQRLVSEAVARGADDNVSVLIVRNGRNAKPSRINKGLVKGVVLVILLAILAAFLLAKPARQNRTPSVPTETAEPTPTAASILNQGAQNDEFELR